MMLGALALGGIGFAGASAYVRRKLAVPAVPALDGNKAAALVRPWSPVIGLQDAPVTLVEFFDPACEACRAFYPIVKDIMAQHGDAVRLVIRYTPFHGEPSEYAVRLLEAARMQGVFEPVKAALLRDQPEWTSRRQLRADVADRIAAGAGLDMAAARDQMRAPDVTAILNMDSEDVRLVGVRATPGFFVNGQPLEPFGEAELRALVARAVAQVTS